MPARVRLGAVAGFDGDRGLGTVVDADGTTFGFHSTAIAGGSRLIEPGTAVAFTLRAAIGGAVEACGIVPIEAS